MIGSLYWYDPRLKLDLATKVRRSIEAYRKKYERLPEVVLVNANEYAEQKPALRGVEVDGQFIDIKPYKAVLPAHYWAGSEEPNISEQAQLVVKQSESVEKKSKKLLRDAAAS